jgi:hypothetical protein
VTYVAYPRRRPAALPGDLVVEPTVVWFDPGQTVGWSVMSVPRRVLSHPEFDPVKEIAFHESGQIDADPPENSISPKVQESLAVQNRACGRGWTDDTSHESAAVQQMLGVVLRYPGALVGTEDFIIRQTNTSRAFLSPVRLMSAFDYACWRYGIQPYRQQPSEAKTAITDVRLKAWGLYDSHGGRHARDSDRHVLAFLRKCKDLRKSRARLQNAWPHIYHEGYEWPRSRSTS